VQGDSLVQVAKVEGLLPSEWLPEERASFRDWVAMRVRIKKPLTVEGLARQIATLERLCTAGFPRKAVCDQSTDNCWQGLFPLKADAYIAPSRTERPKPACVHCGGNGDLTQYDRKPIHARCVDPWVLAEQARFDSARRAS
jgi:hypothetical protein